MQAEAIAKLRAEMNGPNSNEYIQYVGDYLVKHIEQNPGDAQKIMAADKTIGKSLEEIEKAAKQTKRIGNMAMLTPDKGIAIVLKYFGLASQAAVAVPVSVTSVPAPAASGSGFHVDLDELL